MALPGIFRNITVTTFTNRTLEPSAGARDDIAFSTSADQAFLSTDVGQTWPTSLDPQTIFPVPPGEPFIKADQDTAWLDGAGMFVWTMLYGPNAASENRIRLAYTTPALLKSKPNNAWTYVDFTSAVLNLNGYWLDYPHISVGRTFLTITAVFTNNANATTTLGTVIIFVPIRELTLTNPLMHFTFYSELFATNKGGSPFAAANFCGDNVTWAMHRGATKTDSIMRVYLWDSAKNQVTWQDVKHQAWNGSPGTYVSLTPDGQDWLFRIDNRMTGALELRANEWVFAWTAGRDANFPHPYIYLLHLERNFAGVIRPKGMRQIWHRDHAWAYPSIASPAAAGGSPAVAMSCYWGGGKVAFPNHSVGFLQFPLLSKTSFDNLTVGPSKIFTQGMGDYLSVRRYARTPGSNLPEPLITDTYTATGVTMQLDGNKKPQLSSRFVLFE